MLAGHYQDRQAHVLLRSALTADHAAALTGPPPGSGVVVSGLGGVGKSQLAARHARRVWSDPGLDVAVWISAVSRAAVVTAYAEAARRILLEDDRCVAERPAEQAAQAFREWLAATSRRWLVVLDDLGDPADVRGLELSGGPGGQVIVTSRLRGAALARGGYRVIELEVFTEDEALAYFTATLEQHGKGGDLEQLRSLARELGRLPLALGQAAAFIADQPVLTVAGYRRMLADEHRALAELSPPQSRLPEHQLAVAATWSLSIERADRPDDPARPAGAGLARPLLQIASLLDPDGAPLGLFTSTPVLEHLAARADREVSVEDVHDGLTRLHRFTLITLVPARSAREVAVHALLQRAVRDTIPADRLHELARVTAEALRALWPSTDTDDPDLVGALRRSSDTLLAQAGTALWTPAPDPLLDRVGASLAGAGQVDAALAHWRTLHHQAHALLGPDHPDTLTTRHNLAHWRGEAGDPPRAVAELTAVLADRLRLLGPEHPHTLTARNNLAHWRGEVRGGADTVTQLQALLPDQVRILGADHPETLSTRHNLATWLGRHSSAARAAQELQALLPDCLRVLGPDHPYTLTTRHNLTHWQSLALGHNIIFWPGELRDSARVAEEFEALLRDSLHVLGPDHPDTLSTRANLARWRGEVGDPAGAAAQYEAVLTSTLRIRGAAHPDTAHARALLDHWRARAHSAARTADSHDPPEAGFSPAWSDEQSSTLIIRHKLAYLQAMIGNWAGAAAAFEIVLTATQQMLGHDHRCTLAARNNLAHCRGKTGDTAGATAELQALLVDQLRILGPQHPDTLTTRHNHTHWTAAARQHGTVNSAPTTDPT